MEKFMKKMWKKSEGFTLVELIVVIAILGILAAVAVPAYSGYITKAQEADDIIALDAIKTAAMGALASTGEVVGIEVEEKSKITVTYVEEDEEKTTEITAANAVGAADFAVYFDEAIASFELKSGDKATWDNSGDATIATKGKWVIED